MVERWVASAWLLTEKHFRRIDGHEHLWSLGRDSRQGNQFRKTGEGSVIYELSRLPNLQLRLGRPLVPVRVRLQMSRNAVLNDRGASDHTEHVGFVGVVPHVSGLAVRVLQIYQDGRMT